MSAYSILNFEDAKYVNIFNIRVPEGDLATKPESKDAKVQQLLLEKQAMIREAQIIDSYRRVISAINGTIKAIESKKTASQIEDELNNLKFQIQIASTIFNEKKFREENYELIMKLAHDYEESIVKIPQLEGLQECLEIFKGAFYAPLPADIFPLDGDTKLAAEDLKQAIIALNYAGIINDKIKEKLKDAKTAEDLTIFKEDSGDNGDNPAYMKNYSMIDEHAERFKDHIK